jgi:NitT/TauT family transport system substrate-binding protein
LTSFAAITTALFTLSGCGLLNGSEGANSASGGSGNLEKAAVKVGGLPTLDRAVVHLAQDKGYFKDEGLNVEIQDVASGGQSVSKLISGDVDFALGSYTPFIKAQATGVADLKFVSENLVSAPNLQPVMAMPNSDFKRPEDVAGKKIAITSPGTITEIAAKSVLRDKGIDYSRTQFVPMGFSDMSAALQRGDVDGAVMMEPYTTQAARQLGAKTIFDIYSGATEDFPVAGIAAKADFAQQNPKTVQAFQRAINRAKETAQDRQQIVPLLPQHTKVPVDVAPLIELGSIPTTTEASRLQRVATLMYSFQLIPNLDVKNMVLPPPPPKPAA